MNSSGRLRKSSRKSMKFCCKVWMKKITTRNPEHKPENDQKGKRVQIKRGVHLMKPKIQRTKSRREERDRSTIWKVSSKRLNPLVLMENLRLGRKQRHGCWTSKNIFRFTIIPATCKFKWWFTT